jgi:hypothetical protein
MIACWIQITSMVLATEVLLTGCTNLADVATETLSKLIDPSETNAIERGEASETLVRILSTHQATERQRRIGEARALHAYRALRASQSTSTNGRYRLPKTRYIAVNTVREKNTEDTTPLMIYDIKDRTLGETVVGFSEKPQPGTILEIPKAILASDAERDAINVPIIVRDARWPTRDSWETDSVLFIDGGK